MLGDGEAARLQGKETGGDGRPVGMEKSCDCCHTNHKRSKFSESHQVPISGPEF